MATTNTTNTVSENTTRYYERISKNMAYLTREINVTTQEVKEDYDKMRRFQSFIGTEEDLSTFKPLTNKDVVIHYTIEEYADMVNAVRKKINYLMQCKTELSKLADKVPVDENLYSKSFISDFVEKVASLPVNKFDVTTKEISPREVERVETYVKIDENGEATTHLISDLTSPNPSPEPDVKPYESFIGEHLGIHTGESKSGRAGSTSPALTPYDWDDNQQLTTNWNLKDFRCIDDHGVMTKAPKEYMKWAKAVAERLEKMAPLMGVKKVQTTSMYRPLPYERRLGHGAEFSFHPFAAAADISIRQTKLSNMQIWNIGGQAGFTSLIDEGNHVHVDIRKQCMDNPHGGGTYYARRLQGEATYTKLNPPSGASEGDPVVGGDASSGATASASTTGGTTGTGASLIVYNPLDDTYFSPIEKVNFVERTENPEVNKVIVPEGVESWSQLASQLGMSASQLKACNPSFGDDIFSGVSIFVPDSAVTRARQLVDSAHNLSAQLSQQLSSIQSAHENAVHNTPNPPPPPSAPPPDAVQHLGDGTAVSGGLGELLQFPPPAAHPQADPNANKESTVFQTWNNNKEYIKLFDNAPWRSNDKTAITIEYDGKSRVLETIVAPIQVSESFSNAINTHQTNGGWFVSRHGENPVQVNMSGIMLNTVGVAEKHAFVEEWQTFMIDQVDSKTGDYYNKAIIKINVEGTQYQGWITSLNFTKSADKESYYNFNLSFLSVFYKNTRSVQRSIDALKDSINSHQTTANYLGEGIAKTLLRSN